MTIILTKKQEIFCLEYLKDFDGTRAALAAGYSPKSAGVQAHQILQKPHIKAYLKEYIEEKFSKLDGAAEEVIKKYWTVARGKVTDYMKWDNEKGIEIKGSHELSEDEAWNISEIEEGKFGLKLKLNDKSKALDFLAKYFNIIENNEDEKDVTYNVTVEQGIIKCDKEKSDE